jgi:hypothetical protein
MTPEQRSNEGGSTRAMRLRVKIRSALDQDGGNRALVGVSSRMQGRPSAVVRVIHIGAGGEQSFDNRKTQNGVRFGCDTDCEVQERVSIGAAFPGELRVVAQQRFERGNVARFQGMKGRQKGFGGGWVRGRREQVHTLDQVVRFQLREDQNQKQRFENDRTGYRVVVTMSAGTGERGDYVVVDDPHSVDQAASDAERTAAVESEIAEHLRGFGLDTHAAFVLCNGGFYISQTNFAAQRA